MTGIIASFSGGRTSAYMTFLLKKEYPDLRVVFMNTGLEHEKTLEFVNACDKAWGLNIDWIEAVVHHGERKASTHKYTDFENACRGTKVAEEVVKKYGLFGMGYLHCTREMKLSPFNSWVKENNLKDAKIAIGIRSDEMDRVNKDYKKLNLFYPLLNKGITKDDVMDFWNKQDFDLDLIERYGNCKACWKKSNKKIAENAKDHPEWFEEIKTLERVASRGASKMFRGKRSATDILNGAVVDTSKDPEYKGCQESCELFGGD